MIGCGTLAYRVGVGGKGTCDGRKAGKGKGYLEKHSRWSQMFCCGMLFKADFRAFRDRGCSPIDDNLKICILEGGQMKQMTMQELEDKLNVNAWPPRLTQIRKHHLKEGIKLIRLTFIFL